MSESPIRKLVPLANSAVKRGLKVYYLNIGQPDLPAPKEGLDALKTVKRQVLEYSPSQGLESYRKKLIDYYEQYHMMMTPDDIIITTGGSEAILLTLLSILDSGDEVIIPEPVYANYMTLVKTAGGVVRPVTTRIEDGFALPGVDEFEKLIGEKTRAIMICNPNNPTGTVYSDKELEQLRDLVKKYDLYLICDEVYREFVYNGKPYKSAFTLDGVDNNVIILDSVSKRYSECGIRVGALITKNVEIRKAAMKLCQARLSPPLLGQIVAEASLSAPPSYFWHTYEEYVTRRNCLVEMLNKIPGVYSPMPMGAFYTTASLPVEDAEEFCKWCLTDFNYEGETLMMAPAAGFYATPGAGKNQVRIAYVVGIEELKRAMLILEKALAAYPKRL